MPSSNDQNSRQNSNGRKFPFHPFEVFIFFVVTAAFAHSIFRIANEWNPEHPQTEAERNIASSSKSHVFIGCDSEPITKDVRTDYILIQGDLCGLDKSKQSFPKVRITNESPDSNGGSTTTFLYESKGEYRTQAIPLSPGTNRFRATFTYEDNTVVEQEIELNKTL